MGRVENEQYKSDNDIDELKILLEDLLKQIAVMDMDYLYELKDYVQDLIENLEEFELEEDD
jgi:transcription elongation factor